MPKAYSLAPRRVSAGARFFFGIGTHIVLKTHSQDTQVFFLLSFSSLPPPLPFLFSSFFLFFYQNTNLLHSAYLCVIPSGGMEGRTDPAIYPSLLYVLFTCSLFE